MTRVLVIDDDAAVLDSIRTALAVYGFDVATADRADGGLALINEYKPDVIITDIYMPAGDGYQFLAEAHARGVTIPIIAISGGPYAGQLEIAIRLGAAATIEKPFRPASLIDIINHLIGNSAGALARETGNGTRPDDA